MDNYIPHEYLIFPCFNPGHKPIRRIPNRGSYSSEEDTTLMKYRTQGHGWNLISKILTDRSINSLRKRYTVLRQKSFDSSAKLDRSIDRYKSQIQICQKIRDRLKSKIDNGEYKLEPMLISIDSRIKEMNKHI